MYLPEHLITDNPKTHWYPSKGFCISFNTETDKHEVQKIDELIEFDLAKCNNDDEAKIAAEQMGYKFEDKENPLLPTNFLWVN